ncbi:MAG: hypothetical protein WCV82_04115 [Candidatus Paceibacterota bacterium]|jgi:hypothetical protein
MTNDSQKGSSDLDNVTIPVETGPVSAPAPVTPEDDSEETGKKAGKKGSYKKVDAAKVAIEAAESIKGIDPESIKIRSIIPGILVLFHCRIAGGRYTKREGYERSEELSPSEDGEVTIKRVNEGWHVERITEDEEEFKAADAERGQIYRAIHNLSVKTSLGIICPAKRENDLRKVIAACHAKTHKFNETSRTVSLSFGWELLSMSGDNKAMIGAINDSFAEIMDKINQAVTSDEAAILKLESVKKAWLKPFTSVDAVLNAPKDKRIMVMAKVRAELTRKALGEAKAFNAILPEDVSLKMTEIIASIKTQTKAWITASKHGEAEYESAMGAFNSNGISDMQIALVKAATAAENETAQANLEAAGISESEIPVDITAKGQSSLFSTSDPEDFDNAGVV